MKKILITGGAGFIGSHFVKHVLAHQPSWSVINLDLLTYAGNLENLTEIQNNKRHQFFKGDILDKVLTRKLATGCDAILNFAAESHVDRSITGPEAFIQTNVLGTLNLLETAKDCSVKTFLQISTDEVYGSLGPKGLFTEETPLAPNSPYSASKASADLLCRSYFHTFGLKTLITRCSNNYGPFQFPEKLIPLMIMNASKDLPLPVYGDGLNVRDWIYVEDHCTGILKVLEGGRAGEIYNIGGNNEWTNLAIVEEILNLCQKPKSLIKFVKDRPGHDRRYAIDNSKVKKELGWSPKTSFQTGLENTVRWFTQNSEWLDHLITGEYRQYYSRQYPQL